MNYIDLGLPSGNLWVENNENGFFTFEEAVKKFGDSLPTKEDFEELIKYTYRRWDDEKLGLGFLAENENKLFFPAFGFHYDSYVYNVGSHGYYWSSTLDELNYAYPLYFSSDCGNCDFVYSSNQNGRFSVRLIQRPKKEPKYRPYQSAEEVWEDIQKHGSWIKDRAGVYKQITSLYRGAFLCESSRFDKTDFKGYAYNDSLDYTWADDNTPLGKEVR